MLRHLGRALVLLGLLSIAALPAKAQTVDEIIKRGKVIIGGNTTTPIFGILGRDGQPEGYDPDVARLLGKYLGVPVEFVPVTAANRTSFLLSNRIDMIAVRNHAGACPAGLVEPPLWANSRHSGPAWSRRGRRRARIPARAGVTSG